MMLSLVLIEGPHVSEESLRSMSLGNAKQVVVGNAYGFGVVLHLAADSPVDLSNALRECAQVSGVTGVLTLALRTSQ
jgi:copper homeostasis protein CutC